MKKKPANPPEKPPAMVHMMFGEPDDGCEICRAHGLVGKDLPKEDGLVIVEPLTMHQVLECTCPLCSQMPKNASEAK